MTHLTEKEKIDKLDRILELLEEIKQKLDYVTVLPNRGIDSPWDWENGTPWRNNYTISDYVPEKIIYNHG